MKLTSQMPWGRPRLWAKCAPTLRFQRVSTPYAGGAELLCKWINPQVLVKSFLPFPVEFDSGFMLAFGRVVLVRRPILKIAVKEGFAE